MARLMVQLLAAKDILLFRLLMAFISVLAWTTMGAAVQHTAVGLVCVSLCLTALLRQWPLGRQGRQTSPHPADEATSSYCKSISETNAMLWHLLLIWLLVSSWTALCADNMGEIVGTAGMLALGVLVAGPGWGLAHGTAERVRTAAIRLSKAVGHNFARAATARRKKMTTQNQTSSRLTLLHGVKESDQMVALLPSASRSL